MPQHLTAEHYLDTALDALATGDVCPSVLDKLPVPIYTVDATGAVTYWNRACAEFAGREPKLGEDRWCVTWQLYTTDGERLPHAQCPMAQAISEQREIRGAVAIAMRPDGSRRAFRPYPTPLFDDAGRFIGAVNLLVDVTEKRRLQYLQEQAIRCRRLAVSVDHAPTASTLTEMAAEYEAQAEQLRQAN